MMDKMYYFTLGFCLMGLVAMIVVAYNPIPESVTDVICKSCGANQWWFVATGD